MGRLLHRLGYRLQSPRKRQEGATHPDRNAQFEHINQTADEHLAAGQPVVSVDTKKKELVGNFKNGGREWQPKGTPPAVLVHDFPTDAEARRFRTASTTWAQRSLGERGLGPRHTGVRGWRRFDTGGIRWVAAPTPRPRPCSSRPMRREQRVSVARLEA